jgi:hypothetical protein
MWYECFILSVKLKFSAMNYHDYQSCINACLQCAALCNHCSSECLKEDDVKMMSKCIQSDMECAAICYASAQAMSLGSERSKELCKLCAQACIDCANECSHHNAKHCQECADACRKCATECNNIAA